MKNILLLGAGMTSPPLIRYFLDRREYRIVVAAQELERVQPFLETSDRVRALTLDATDTPAVDRLVRESDVVVCLLPAFLQAPMAKMAIAHRKNFVSTSYQSPAVRELDHEAKKAGVAVLSETGLDPGIDHMSAVHLVNKLRSRSATITHFSSCCGGFPAPDAHDNPWGYKFSWNPRGVVLAGRESARYLRNGNTVEVDGPDLFAHHWPFEVESQGVFEIYPNRDSISYIDLYGLNGVVNMFRGTIRYPGWCDTMKAAADLGLFDVTVREWPEGTTYADFLTRLLPENGGALVARVARFLGIDPDSEIITRLEWAGFFSDRPLPRSSASALDIFVDRLQKMMVYRPGERDMVAMQHNITAIYPDGRHEYIRSTLAEIGKAWGDSAMARTVTLPAAIATRLLLDRRRIHATGALIPVIPELYESILEELAAHGIGFRETSLTSYPSPFTH
ncbi:MAG: saccharopine dehydrogenase C-terminal domain-containing protein [Thermoanaerobaculia bacterium]